MTIPAPRGATPGGGADERNGDLMSGTIGSASAAAPDRELAVLCDDDGAGTLTPFLRRYSVTDAGATTATDTELDGVTPYAVAGTVVRCAERTAANPQIAAVLQRLTGADTAAVPAGVRSVTVVVLAGEPEVQIGAAPAVPVPAVTSLSWGVDRGGEAGEALAEGFTVTTGAGDDVLVTYTQEL